MVDTVPDCSWGRWGSSRYLISQDGQCALSFVFLPSSLHSWVASPDITNPVGQEKETIVPMFVLLVFTLNVSLV